MSNLISGYLVVRKIDHQEAFVNEYPKDVNGVVYQGFQRDSFCDMSRLYLNGELQEPYLECYLLARANDDGYIGEYITDYSDALKALEFSNNASGEANEIIAFSTNTSNILHCGDLELIGLDILFYAGSLLYEGIFNNTAIFEEYVGKLTKFGLMPDDNDLVYKYIKDYCLLSQNKGNYLEPTEVYDIKNIVKLWRTVS